MHRYHIRKAALAIGDVEMEGSADLTFLFSFMPRFPMVANIWVKDEEFPASVKVLYNRSAEHNLKVEAAGTLLVTHDMGVIAYMADLVGVMYKGRLVEWGTREDILLHAAHDYTKALISAIPKLGEAFHSPERYVAEIGAIYKPSWLSDTHWVLE